MVVMASLFVPELPSLITQKKGRFKATTDSPGSLIVPLMKVLIVSKKHYYCEDVYKHEKPIYIQVFLPQFLTQNRPVVNQSHGLHKNAIQFSAQKTMVGGMLLSSTRKYGNFIETYIINSPLFLMCLALNYMEYLQAVDIESMVPGR